MPGGSPLYKSWLVGRTSMTFSGELGLGDSLLVPGGPRANDSLCGIMRHAADAYVEDRLDAYIRWRE
jgi:hypothetical protein